MLSATSIKNYETLLKRMHDNGITEDKIVNYQNDVVAWIETKASPSGSPNSKASFLSAVLYLLKTKHPDADKKIYDKKMKVYAAAQREKAKSQTLPPNKKEKLLPWKEIVELRSKAKADLSPEEYLIYCLYTMQPPVRVDFAPMHIVSRTPKYDTSNYLVTTKDIKNWKFIFNHHKMSHSIGQVVLDIPFELKKVIHEYIVEKGLNSGDSLLTYSNPAALAQKINIIFKKLTGKRIGVSLLRHSFITDFLSSPRTIKQKEEMGRRMMHSKGMQEEYAIMDDV